MRRSAASSSPVFNLTVPPSKLSIFRGKRILTPLSIALSSSEPNAAGFWMSMAVTSFAPRRKHSLAASIATFPAPTITTDFSSISWSHLPILVDLRKWKEEIALFSPVKPMLRGFCAPTARMSAVQLFRNWLNSFASTVLPVTNRIPRERIRFRSFNTSFRGSLSSGMLCMSLPPMSLSFS